MVRIICVRDPVSPNMARVSDVGRFWDFPDFDSASSNLGHWFTANCCEVKNMPAPREGFRPCGQAGCDWCDPD